jgi:hypothetical protein
MSMLNRAFVILLAAVIVVIGGTNPAFATKEERIRTEAIEIFVPKSFKAPKSGCSFIPIRYEWRYFMNHETIGAFLTIETKDDWIISSFYLQPDITGSSGVVDMRVCSTRWVGDEEVVDGKLLPGEVFQRAKKGNYFFELDLWDFDNKENMIQYGRKQLRLR